MKTGKEEITHFDDRYRRIENDKILYDSDNEYNNSQRKDDSNIIALNSVNGEDTLEIIHNGGKMNLQSKNSSNSQVVRKKLKKHSKNPSNIDLEENSIQSFESHEERKDFKGYSIHIVLLIVGYIFFGLCNNIGVQMMGYKMAPYPEFLLYGTTAMYVLLFALGALIKSESFKLQDKNNKIALHKQFLLLGLWTSINGVLSQFAIPFVEHELTSLLTQIALPITWISSWYIFRYEINILRICCGIMILGGLTIGLSESYINGTSGEDVIKNSGWFWILCTVLSAIPTAFETTYQEKVFKKMKAPRWVTLTYYNLYSLITYFVTMPLTMTNQFKVFGYNKGFTWKQM